SLYSFDSPQYLQSLEVHFREKYRNRPPSIIITIGPDALRVTPKLRDALWPQTPIVFAAVDQRAVTQLLPAGVTGRTYKTTLASMLDAAKIIVPDFKTVVLVGNSFGAQSYYRNFAAELPEYAAKYHVIDLMGMPLDELRGRIGALPDDSVILYFGIDSDAR